MAETVSDGSVDIAQTILDIVHQSKHSPSDIGETWYIVDKQLLDKLSDESPQVKGSEIKMTNRRFLVDADIGQDCIDCNTLLDENLASGLGQEFDVVDEESWRNLRKCVSVDVEIPRRVYMTACSKKLIVEVQPVKLEIFSWPKSQGSPQHSAPLVVSVGETVKHAFARIGQSQTEFKTHRFLIGSVDGGTGCVKKWMKFAALDEDSMRTIAMCQIDMAVAICCAEEDHDELDTFSLPADPTSTLSAPFVSPSAAMYPSQPPSPRESSGGLVGLSNLGNTCFMNSALQCLSKITALTDFFLNGFYLKDINAENPIGTGGELAECYAMFLKEMFNCKRGDSFAPRQLKCVIGRYHEQFEGYLQQDSQELLAFLLDGLHEDLNRVKRRPGTEPVEGNDDSSNLDVARESWKRHKQRNDSIVVDMFQGQYRSRLQCSKCSKVSIVFDPFMYLTLPLPEPIGHVVKLVANLGAAGAYRICMDLNLYGTQYFFTLLNIKEHMRKYLIEVLTRQQMNDPALAKAVVESLKDANLPRLECLTVDELVVAQPTVEQNRQSMKLMKDEKIFKKDALTLYCWILPRWQAASMAGLKLEGMYDVADSGLSTAEVPSAAARPSLSPRPSSLISRLRCGIGFSSEQSDGEESPSAVASNDRVATKIEDVVTVIFIFNTAEVVYTSLWTTTVCQPCSELYQAAAAAAQRYKQQYGDDVDIGVDNEVGTDTGGAPGSEMNLILNGVSNRDNAFLPKDASLPNSEKQLSDVLPCLSSAACRFISVVNSGIEPLPADIPCCEALIPEAPTVDRCMKMFLEKEILGGRDSWYCPRCKEHVSVTKNIDLWSLPAVLILHLKRFQNTGRIHRSKLDTLVMFPHKRGEILDMKPYMLAEGLEHMVSNQPDFNAEYELIGVNCHSGGLGGGHYTANVLTGGRWIEYNDSFVRECSQDSLEVPEAYLLFYQLRNSIPSLRATSILSATSECHAAPV
eukprot:GHVQ01014013.1.p2 GENE.GHVQ01014013.1~~GHVQ01014013.1.p2  ORF type:complete len:973 (-),score=103.36 GHVQ01014013.1:4518-7436(-)